MIKKIFHRLYSIFLPIGLISLLVPLFFYALIKWSYQNLRS